MISCARTRFLSYGSHFRKSRKKRQKITFFNFVLLYANALFLSFAGGYFTTLKWLKLLILSKICFKMVKAMTPKTNNQNILFLNELIPFNLYCRFNECGNDKSLLITTSA